MDEECAQRVVRLQPTLAQRSRNVQNVLAGLTLPRLSDVDPDELAEGGIDPLGLLPPAEFLVEQFIPDVTARMQRIRFLTAIAVAGVVAERVVDQPAADGVTPPWLACEWLIVEAMAGSKDLPAGGTFGLPGVLKTRSVLSRRGHLTASTYLKAPVQNGFHGVYKRLAIALELVDPELGLLPRAYELVECWEREQNLPGFSELRAGTEGGNLATRLVRAIGESLRTGAACQLAGASRLAAALALGSAEVQERRLVWEWLTTPDVPLRREVIRGLRRTVRKVDIAEVEAIRRLRTIASPDLAMHVDAVEAYEAVANALTSAFQAVQVRSRQKGLTWLTIDEAAQLEEIQQSSRSLPDLCRRLLDQVAELGPGALARVERAIVHFAEPVPPGGLVEALLDHHERVQKDRPGMRRSWFERGPHGIMVRPAYGLDDVTAEADAYLHPMRINALLSFISDLR